MPDRDDFGGWADPHVLAMTRLAARLVRSADVDDVVQASLMRAWRRRHTFDDTRGSARTWLLAIVVDQSRRHRTRSWVGKGVGLHPPENKDTSTEIVDAVDIDHALQSLSPRQRLAVELFYFVGLSVKECAEVMSCSVGTVKSTLSDARLRLAPLLEVRL